MTALSDGVKAHIVQGLAQFQTPTDVADSVKQEFGITIGRQQVAAYDPTKVTGRNLGKKWRAIFEATRKRFLENVADVPIANLAYRMQQYQAQLDGAGNNKILKLRVLEQAAKEIGGIYENRRLDQPKTPGAEDQPPRAEYTLAPDEDVPAKPIL